MNLKDRTDSLHVGQTPAVLTYDARGNGDGATVNLRNREGKPGPIAFDTKQDGSNNGDVAPTLNAMTHRDGNPNGGGQMGVVVPSLFTMASGQANAETFRMVAFGEYATDGTASAIKARDWKDATDLVLPAVGIPRRLMPTETEKLMGWPSGWTAYGIAEDGTRYALSDTARYRLCGNGVASPVAAWIGFRLAAALA